MQKSLPAGHRTLQLSVLRRSKTVPDGRLDPAACVRCVAAHPAASLVGHDVSFSVRHVHQHSPPSPSSRRAWIEIPFSDALGRRASGVALLAEGVDRNSVSDTIVLKADTSPSSRRAWIEISLVGALSKSVTVALLAEGVDRNIVNRRRGFGIVVALLAEGVDRNSAFLYVGFCLVGRPPRGGRG